MEGHKHNPLKVQIELVMAALRQLCGDKRYMHDLQKLLETLSGDGQDQQTLRYLYQDLQQVHNDLSRAKRQPWRKW